jgi:hypothetical protein
MNKLVPKRFNANSVAKFAHVIREVCAAWPQAVMVNPAPYSVETYRSRFRDAMTGVVIYQQGPSDLYLPLVKLSEPVVVAERDGLLWIGPKSAARTKPENALQAGLVVSGIATLANNEQAITSPDKAVIQAIALLTSYGILDGARITGVTEEFIYTCFPEDYEGGVVANPDGTFSIY